MLFHNLFPGPLGLEPCTSCSIHFLTPKILTTCWIFPKGDQEFSEGSNKHTRPFNGPFNGSGISWAICKSERYACQRFTTQFFTGRMPFLLPSQQCQSTEGYCAQIKHARKFQVCRSKNCFREDYMNEDEAAGWLTRRVWRRVTQRTTAGRGQGRRRHRSLRRCRVACDATSGPRRETASAGLWSPAGRQSLTTQAGPTNHLVRPFSSTTSPDHTATNHLDSRHFHCWRRSARQCCT